MSGTPEVPITTELALASVTALAHAEYVRGYAEGTVHAFDAVISLSKKLGVGFLEPAINALKVTVLTEANSHIEERRGR